MTAAHGHYSSLWHYAGKTVIGAEIFGKSLAFGRTICILIRVMSGMGTIRIILNGLPGLSTLLLRR